LNLSLRNCPNCGRVFTYAGKDLCPVCLREEEERFDRLRLYLREHPQASVDELSEATGVAVKTILKYLREGRLIMAPQKSRLYCEICGEPISHGRFCRRCSAELVGEVRSLTEGAEKGKFHTAERFRKREEK